CTRDYRYFDVW
nr:immunoglobulin heavy chain junction region [Mus musculus]